LAAEYAKSVVSIAQTFAHLCPLLLGVNLFNRFLTLVASLLQLLELLTVDEAKYCVLTQFVKILLMTLRKLYDFVK
jgi:hypothetical protein